MPRAARAVLSCAGTFVSGDLGSNECPAGSARIVTEAACRTAATAAGKTVDLDFVETASYAPRGCYVWTSYNEAYFNTHAVGAGYSGYQLLCAALATTGTPLKRRCRTDARCASDTARVLRGPRGRCA